MGATRQNSDGSSDEKSSLKLKVPAPWEPNCNFCCMNRTPPLHSNISSRGENSSAHGFEDLPSPIQAQSPSGVGTDKTPAHHASKDGEPVEASTAKRVLRWNILFIYIQKKQILWDIKSKLQMCYILYHLPCSCSALASI
jgi:hypothetical protein